MRALITNDDGIDSTGIRTLAQVAVGMGLEVLVAAPTANRSGASASLAAVEEEGRFVVHPRRLEEVPDVEALAVEAAPAFIVQAAMTGAFGTPPDVVLSGINHGPNTGHSILHSGTVGAAFTAATHGCRALAVSLVMGDPPHFETAAAVARPALEWVCAAEGVVVLNVNAPDVPPGELRGLRRGALATYGAVQAQVAEAGEGWVTLTYADVDAEHEPGTDAALLADGFGAFTPLSSICEAAAVDTTTLAPRT